MDLHFTEHEPDAEEIAAIDGCLAGLSLDGDHRQYLLPVLHAIQGRKGWVSPGALNHACLRLDVPPAEAFGVADFYAMFQTRPHPSVTVHVCDDIACRTRGAEALCAEVEAALGPQGESRDGLATWHRSPCLGLCERAPAALVIAAGHPPRERDLAPATGADVLSVLAGGPVPHPPLSLSVPQAGQPGLRLLARVGRVDPASLDDYRTAGGFLALRRAFEMGPAAVIKEVVESKLVGRGGAAFPTGVKWQGARSAALPRYLICNADESEPGTFKDRVLMENDPFSLIEAMTIAGFATGCEKGYLYLRGEYPLALSRLENAIERCRDRGFLGDNVLGDGVRFDVELRRGAGAYICGEETALMNSIEGRRGEPRNKPPFPTEFGLFGKPTVINNVETLVNVLPIVIEGGKAFAAIGTERSTGPKLFCVSGHVRRPGVYEAPFGITLGELLDLAGGIGGSGRLQAVLLGGAAGAFVTPDQLGAPLTFEGTRAIGATLGSAVVMPFDDTVDLRQILRRIAQFFRDESCGQCVPCRVGTVRQEELLHRLATDRPLGSLGEEVALLKELGQAMRDASICGLGQTASSAIESALARFPIFQRTQETQ
ncbi:MAG TPA: NAD(P)H-dependent oxidoreductase subunit E [Thermoanaerobaculia bacterium]|jgi:NADH-quinone oxidoreductase subunit F|nr:NAD(P)H-dependent oxidoreductase subunit E [Thermoanaerobaculia bacterium]